MELKLFTDLIDALGSRRGDILLLTADDNLRREAARLNNTTNRLR